MASATVLAISFLIAWLRGGRLCQEVPGLGFPLAALAVQLPLSLLFPGTPVAMAANVAGYLLLIPFWWRHRHSPGLALVLAGLALNLAVIAANGGQMPVDFDLAARMGLPLPAGPLPKHRPLGPETRLAFLADVIPLPLFHRVVSVGDLLLMAGVFLYVQEVMGVPLLRCRSSPARAG